MLPYWFTAYMLIIATMADAMATHNGVLAYGLQAEANPVVWGAMYLCGPLWGLIVAKSLIVQILYLTHQVYLVKPWLGIAVNLLGAILTFGAASTWALI